MKDRLLDCTELSSGIYGFKAGGVGESIGEFLDPTKLYRINTRTWMINQWAGRTVDEVGADNFKAGCVSTLGTIVSIAAGIAVGIVRKDAVSGIVAATIVKFGCNFLTHLVYLHQVDEGRL